MWGAIIGGALSYMGASKQADAQDRANEANMASFNQYKPYVDAALAGGKGSLANVLNTGNYTGATLADPNAFLTRAAGSMGNTGLNWMNMGNSMMDQTGGFVGNTNDIYNRFSNIADSAGQDRMATANQYALDNYGSISDALLRDDRRNLLENTLPGVDMAASGSGNSNASRAGVATALANRAYGDRAADVRSDVISQLRNASLNQQNQQFNDMNNSVANMSNANSAVGNVFNSGMNLTNTGFGNTMNAGNAIMGYDQAKLNDAKARFEADRDFALNQYKDYKGTMVGNAPSTSNQYQANTVSPWGAALGGAMAGQGWMNQYGNSIGNSSFFNPMFGNSTFGVGGYT